MPRDGAGRMDLIGGTGALVHPISMPGFIEVYKVDRTFQMQSPDNVDPSRTMPNAPWTWRISDEVGCANPIVGRVFIQCAEALHNKRLKRGDPEEIRVALHACKEDLRNCEKAFQRMATAYDRFGADISRSGGLQVEGGVINNLPLIPDLEHDITIFLTSAKRALQSLAEVLNQFYGIAICNARFDKGWKQLEVLNPPPSPRLFDILGAFKADIERVLELRNFQEHTPKKTIVENFSIIADALHPPRWRVEPAPPTEMLPEMRKMLGRMINLVESCFFVGLMDNVENPPRPFAYFVEDIPKEHRRGAEIHYRCECMMTGGLMQSGL